MNQNLRTLIHKLKKSVDSSPEARTGRSYKMPQPNEIRVATKRTRGSEIKSHFSHI